MGEYEKGLRGLLLELVEDMQEFCYQAEGLEPCGLARALLRDVRERLRRVDADLDVIAPEPPPVPLWPRRERFNHEADSSGGQTTIARSENA